MTITLYDADRCPYCARVRIVLHDKGVEWEAVAIDLADRPAWLYEKDPKGKVPVLEEDALVLPESAVIMEYLEERYPEPALLPQDPADRALVRLWIERFEKGFAEPYYALRRGEEAARAKLEAALGELDAALGARPYLSGDDFGLGDVAYLPWVLRLPSAVGVEIDAHEALVSWRHRVAERESVAREVEVVEALAG